MQTYPLPTQKQLAQNPQPPTGRTPPRPPLPPPAPTGTALSPAQEAFAWVIQEALRRELGGQAVGWEFMMSRDGQELVIACEGSARAQWEQGGSVATGPDVRTHIASMSKPITASTLMALSDDWNQVYSGIQSLIQLLGSHGIHISMASFAGTADWHDVFSGLPVILKNSFQVSAFNNMSTAFVRRVAQYGQQLTPQTPLMDLIGHRITSPGAGVNQIQLWHLLTHQSGMNFDNLPPAPWDANADTCDMNALLNQYLSRALAQPPGQGFPGYHNEHYIILRAVIEECSTMGYEGFVKQRMFSRINCPHASCHNDDPQPTLYYPQVVASVASPDAEPVAGVSWPNWSSIAGAWGWYVSPRELNRFLWAIAQNSLMAQSTTTTMLSQGLGWGAFQWPGWDGHGHNGGWSWNGGGYNGCYGIFSLNTVASLQVTLDGIDAQGIFQRVMAAPLPVIRFPDRYVAGGITLHNPIGLGDLRYTTDGTPPGATSPIYSGPITLAGAASVQCAVFDGTKFLTPIVNAQYQWSASELLPATTDGATAQGMRWSCYDGAFTTVANFPVVASTGTTLHGFDLTVANSTQNFGLEFRAYLQVPTDGVYNFTLQSDDGSQLWVGDALIVDDDGLHGDATTVAGIPIRLQAGKHPIRITYFQGGGGQSLTVNWSGPGIANQPIPAASLYYVP